MIYKHYEILEKDGEFITIIEDGMFTYSNLIDKHKTLKDSKDRINRYTQKINSLYNK